ncbi:MAG TPA: Plug domain-containing protein, partial [Steroidobacteraceae bacterium]
MKRNTILSSTVGAILASAAHAGWAAAPAATSAADAGATQLQPIVVTATRFSENVQDVPITVQALTGQTLQQLHVQTLSDYLKYVPNVTMAAAGPGQANLYMRGLSLGAGGPQASGAVGQFPNVALYLDEESTELPDRQLDIYAVDLERVEVLEGPQGTLFGAGAQAGVIRY